MLPSLGTAMPPAPGRTGLESPYAAMPSGHAAFAVIVAGTIVCVSRHRLVRLAAALYPPAVLLEIVATCNHICLDAVAGADTAALGFVLARRLERTAGSPLHPAWRRRWLTERSGRKSDDAVSDAAG
jgi:hypothetical protein